MEISYYYNDGIFLHPFVCDNHRDLTLNIIGRYALFLIIVLRYHCQKKVSFYLSQHLFVYTQQYMSNHASMLVKTWS